MNTNSIRHRANEIQSTVRDAARDAAERVQRNLETSYSKTRDGVVRAGKATDDYVQSHPWTVVGVSLGVGFLLGLLVNLRR